ncbi:MAG TPA: hypothetical protein VJA21_33435 [Verrucomicrobiae bacterium]
MYNGQLEMSFAGGRGCLAGPRRQRRLTRARWWFGVMRQVVDRATDWQPAPPPRPEQIWFPGSHRQVAVTREPVAEAASPEQQQVCE